MTTPAGISVEHIRSFDLSSDMQTAFPVLFISWLLASLGRCEVGNWKCLNTRLQGDAVSELGRTMNHGRISWLSNLEYVWKSRLESAQMKINVILCRVFCWWISE